MSPRGPQRGAIHDFLLDSVTAHPHDLVTYGAEHFGMSRQALHRHVRQLIDTGDLFTNGKRRPTYALPDVEIVEHFETPSVDEGVLWTRIAAPVVRHLPENIRTIAAYGFTEMVNNARDHSQSPMVSIVVRRTPALLEIKVLDAGVGIFEKIRSYAGLASAAEAVFELSKGKFTTDPARHSGQGIFFTSRIFDEFTILSRGIYFSHERGEEDWILESKPVSNQGTSIFMQIAPTSQHTVVEVFDRFATSPEHYDFSKTIIAVKLLETASEELISRSQAKRLTARLHRFTEVILDFQGVASIGQAFADEIFRVFRSHHGDIRLIAVNTAPEVARMIQRAQVAFVAQTIDPERPG